MNSDLGFTHIFQPSPSGAQRVLLVLHGTGGDETSLLPIAKLIDPEAAILSVKGKVLENGAPRYFRRLAEGVFDMEDLHFRTQELADFVAEAKVFYCLNPDQIMAVGYSNGANIAASLLLARPETINGGILLRAMVPFEPPSLNNLRSKRIFISEGQFDPIVPTEHGTRLAELFRERGADVTLLWNETDHRLSQSEIKAAKEWLG